jgi:hypothetical protein
MLVHVYIYAEAYCICIEDWVNKSYLTVFLGEIAGNNIFIRFLVQADVDIWLKAVEGKVTEKEWRDFFTSKGSSVALTLKVLQSVIKIKCVGQNDLNML